MALWGRQVSRLTPEQVADSFNSLFEMINSAWSMPLEVSPLALAIEPFFYFKAQRDLDLIDRFPSGRIPLKERKRKRTLRRAFLKQAWPLVGKDEVW
jgi:hypothetical protein